MEGLVNRFFQDRGYGFIQDTEGHAVHVRADEIQTKRVPTLYEWMRVRFNRKTNSQGYIAKNVRVLDPRGNTIEMTNGASMGKILPVNWRIDLKQHHRVIFDEKGAYLYVDKEELRKAEIYGNYNYLRVGYDIVWKKSRLAAENLWLP